MFLSPFSLPTWSLVLKSHGRLSQADLPVPSASQEPTGSFQSLRPSRLRWHGVLQSHGVTLVLMYVLLSFAFALWGWAAADSGAEWSENSLCASIIRFTGSAGLESSQSIGFMTLKHIHAPLLIPLLPVGVCVWESVLCVLFWRWRVMPRHCCYICMIMCTSA